MEIYDKQIILEKELNPLDLLVIDFTKALGRSPYVLISGYVSILFGRSRSSEDIDILIKPLPRTDFLNLCQTLLTHGFVCITAEQANAFDEHLSKGLAVHFARKGSSIPNMEVKFATGGLLSLALHDRIMVEIGQDRLFISPIELQIPYKQHCLGSEKDLEDARHLEIVFEGKLSAEKLNKYSALIDSYGC